MYDKRWTNELKGWGAGELGGVRRSGRSQAAAGAVASDVAFHVPVRELSGRQILASQAEKKR